MTTSAELGLPALTVSPGGVATTTLTVRNGTDIVEAYSLEVVGECAPWTTVEPARVSLYPGTSETVTVQLAPPRSPEVRAGDFPLGIRVLPAERPELVTVPETTVTVTPFHELQAEIAPRRRRGWLRARYRAAVRNLGNAPSAVTFAPAQAGEDLRFGVAPDRLRLQPGESAEVRVRVRARKLIWFGKPASWPFEVAVGGEPAAEAPGGNEPGGKEPGTQQAAPQQPGAQQPAGQRRQLHGEFVQLPILPRWLLALLAALIALLLAWFALVRPAVRSSAKQAAQQVVDQHTLAPSPPPTAAPPTPGASGGATGGQGQPGAGQPSTGQQGGTGGGDGGDGGSGRAVPGTGEQSSATIDVQTASGAAAVGSYQVPAGKVLGITDIVVANFQGDQGLLTIKFGDQTITTIALETFRNQDYHWVTPIEVTENQTVTASVTCQQPGTPASGKQASQCHELLNVSGELSDLKH
ncbi:hydrolytic protein [Kitasatospora sp. NBC_01250]|uniref:COG1470 family protein n=1 Tax=unclassified Kitasatospora TaxID=2633591 RepID=UPI002E0F1ABE|nr:MULTISPECIES: hydrolytic protein [unclassified Kitasatospora]WSJ65377.1 hydrolytic protein [Kitasatospora sp. NBC_01302]